MTRTIKLLAIALILFTTNSFSQYQQQEIQISFNEVPSDVYAAHKEKYPTSFDVNWEKKFVEYLPENQETYIVTFKMNGIRGHKAFYNQEFGFLAYVGRINGFDLPESIQLEAFNYVEDNFIKYGQIIQLEEPSIFIYRVKINNNGLLQYFYFDKFGNKIPRRSLSPNIFAYI